MEESNNMPKRGLYLFFVIAGFCLGILWGILSLSPYNKMKFAIEDGDEDVAWANAKKIRTYFIISLIVSDDVRGDRV